MRWRATVLVAGMALAMSALGASAAIVQTMPCGSGPDDDLTLWMDGALEDCKQTTDEFRCGRTNRDYVRASCADGCNEVRIGITNGSAAGCWRGANPPGAERPNFTVTCASGVTIDLRGVQGDTCVSKRESGGGAVVSAMCSHVQNGQKYTSALATCESGCELSTPPGDCTQR
ncbi:MAG TPA: hypothetical protein VFB67_13750 [Candidatus Polarisedimenticolaceae bacterium]|nr:hypothetical protein [Candidatus Polarisedimenticolaceae bacterium]